MDGKPRLSLLDTFAYKGIWGSNKKANLLDKYSIENLYKEELRYRNSNFWTHFNNKTVKLGSDQFVAAMYLKDTMVEQREQHEEFMSNLTDTSDRRNIEAIAYSTNLVCGTFEKGVDTLSKNLVGIHTSIDKGFNQLDERLGDISEELSGVSYQLGEISLDLKEIASILDSGFSDLVSHQKATNVQLANLNSVMNDVALFSTIPDVQKEKAYALLEGLRYMAAVKESNDKSFDKAKTFWLQAKAARPNRGTCAD